MSTLYTDDNGLRVIVRHKGPAGRGIAPGGTTGQILTKNSADDFDTEWSTVAAVANAVIGPASAADLRVAVFDGVTGKLIKDGGKTIAELALLTALDGKVDVASNSTNTGNKVLSDVDFTFARASKLDGLLIYYKGSYPAEANLPATATIGDYAILTTPPLLAFCAATNVWTVIEVAMTAEDIAELIFNADDYAANFSGPTWDLDNCRVFTNADKATLETVNQFLGAGAGASVTPYIAKSTDYTATASDRTIDVTGAYTISLPTALTNQGSVFTVKNSGVDTVTVDCVVGTQTIDGDLTVSLATKESVTVQSTGSNYIIL